MMERLCDLHTHSVFSDGTYTPEQLLDAAEQCGLSAIALTDHNTVSGLPSFLEYAKNKAVWAIPGIEFSTDYREKDIHILGLFIPPAHYGEITEMLRQSQLRKVESNRDLVKNLNRAGYALDYDKICAQSHDGQFNRAHVAREMVRLGYVAERDEAFATVLRPEAGYYHPPKRMTSAEAITYIKSIGAAAVLAHPLLTFKEQEAREFLRIHTPLGLDAMETEYSTYSPAETEQARALAAQFGLLCSGGSDFHGSNKPTISLGTGKGNLAISTELAEKLWAKCRI